MLVFCDPDLLQRQTFTFALPLELVMTRSCRMSIWSNDVSGRAMLKNSDFQPSPDPKCSHLTSACHVEHIHVDFWILVPASTLHLCAFDACCYVGGLT